MDPKEFKIETGSPVPLYEQIKRDIKLKILSGHLLPDKQLTPIREYARLLKVNPNTIVKVYYQLDMEGYLYSKPGLGYFVIKPVLEPDPENKKLFRQITDEYLHKAAELGFSFEYILNHIKARKKNMK